MSEGFFARKVVSAWISYPSCTCLQLLDEQTKQQRRQELRRIIESTLDVLECIGMSDSTREFILAFARVLLEIVEIEQAWWSYELLDYKLKSDPLTKRYAKMLPQLIDDEPAASNAVWWAKQWAKWRRETAK